MEHNAASAGVCRGCAGPLAESFVRLPAYPVIQNYRYDSPVEARSVPRRDLELRQCTACGLVFNNLFDPTVLPYDERYENRQNHSSAFMHLMTEVADQLAGTYPLKGGPLLEVGCGKGEFLKLICGRHDLRGLGYDTSCEVTGLHASEKIEFFRRYVSPADVVAPVSAVICRHVIEHVPDVGEFMALLKAVFVAGDAKVAYVEAPCWEWIVEQNAFWDVFYEHCNYFSMTALRHLAEQAGFRVLRHRLIFAGQYQGIELALNGAEPLAAPGIPDAASLKKFASHFDAAPQLLQRQLVEAGAGRGWAIWGAGAKGVALANALNGLPPAFLIDSNPAKQGTFIPGAGIPVIAPTDPRMREIAVVLIANPVYAAEIKESLALSGFRPRIITL